MAFAVMYRRYVSGFHRGFFVREGKESIMQSTLLLGWDKGDLGTLCYMYVHRRLVAEMLLHVEIYLALNLGVYPLPPAV